MAIVLEVSFWMGHWLETKRMPFAEKRILLVPDALRNGMNNGMETETGGTAFALHSRFHLCGPAKNRTWI